jgi:hypothetical protein
MTLAEIETRLRSLEKNVKSLLADRKKAPGKNWWRESSGRFADDAAFDEIVRLGKNYRKSAGKRGR